MKQLKHLGLAMCGGDSTNSRSYSDAALLAMAKQMPQLQVT